MTLAELALSGGKTCRIWCAGIHKSLIFRDGDLQLTVQPTRPPKGTVEKTPRMTEITGALNNIDCDRPPWKLALGANLQLMGSKLAAYGV